MKLKSFIVTAVAVMGLHAAQTQASAILNWGLSTEDQQAGAYNYTGAEAPYTAMSTGGLQTLNAGNASASVKAWGDAVNGMFKSYTSVRIDSDNPLNVADAYASMGIGDTLRFSGPLDTVDVAFHLSYDTFFSGIGLEPFDREDQFSHFMQVWSNRGIEMNWQTANPNFDPDAQCIDDGEWYYCPDEAIEFYSHNFSENLLLFREWALGGPTGMYSNGDAENGLYSGTLSFVVTVPVELDISFDYSAFNSSRCFNLQQCDLTVDAQNSDYIRMEVLGGGSFSSANGYRYVGNMPGNVPVDVPAPASLLLMLGGLGLLARRRTSARR